MAHDTRVTDTEVKKIIETELDTTPFIETASVLIEQYLEDSNLSEDLLKKIELWWSAHLTAIRELQSSEEAVGKAKVKYQGKTDMGLNATLYGQQVLILDPTGILADIGNINKRAKFETIGSPTEATQT